MSLRRARPRNRPRFSRANTREHTGALINQGGTPIRKGTGL